TATAISFTAATFTVCVICVVLPQGSVAVQVMMVCPAGYGSLSPIPSLRVGTGVIAPEQASLAVGVVGMTVAALAVHPPASALTSRVVSVDDVNVGAVVSTTVINCPWLTLLLQSSVAVHVRVKWYRGWPGPVQSSVVTAPSLCVTCAVSHVS